MSRKALPWEAVGPEAAHHYARPGIVVDLRRCIGCHACSVACKTEHGVPLGEFRMRVRWLPRPDRPGIAFLPLFNATSCDLGANRSAYGLDPACVAACPTRALAFGDMGDPDAPVTRLAKAHKAKPLQSSANTREGILYIGHEPWQERQVNRGVELSPDDIDIIYEQ